MYIFLSFQLKIILHSWTYVRQVGTLFQREKKILEVKFWVAAAMPHLCLRFPIQNNRQLHVHFSYFPT